MSRKKPTTGRMATRRTKAQKRRLFVTLRILFFASLLLGAFGLIAWRLHHLQIERTEELTDLALGRYLHEIKLPGRRGAIFDRNHVALAISIDVESIYAQPYKIEDPERVARILAPILELDARRIAAKLRTASPAGKKGRKAKKAPGRYFTWLKRRVSPTVADRVRALELEGIALTPEPKRFYPSRDLAAHVLGFAGMDGTGVEGLEARLDENLAGVAREVPGLRDALGRFVFTNAPEAPEATEGSSVVLSIDRTIQFIAERALYTGVTRWEAAAGSVVVMDPRTGDILAMANLPTFNPNAPGDSAAAERRNRAVTDAFEPGSVFKPFLMATALEHGLVRPDEIFHGEWGRFRIGKHIIHDSHGHGELTATECISKSSNICMSKIAARVGAERLGATLTALGFGSRPDTVLPGAARGMMRPPEKWRTVELATIGFGHGISSSVLQLASGYATIARGGSPVKPRMIRGWLRPGGALEEIPVETGDPVWSTATVDALREMLIKVARVGGTAKRAAVPGYVVAGKTGTAHKVDMVSGGYRDDAFISTFAGFAPAHDPRLVIIVTIDEPQGEHVAGLVAAPVFAEIARLALRHLGVPTSEPVHAEKPAPMATVEDGTDPSDLALAVEADAVMMEAERTKLPEADAGASSPPSAGAAGETASEATMPPPSGVVFATTTVPDFTGLSIRTAARLAVELGLLLEVEGNGVAVVQSVAAGTELPVGGSCRVTFRPPV